MKIERELPERYGETQDKVVSLEQKGREYQKERFVQIASNAQ